MIGFRAYGIAAGHAVLGCAFLALVATACSPAEEGAPGPGGLR